MNQEPKISISPWQGLRVQEEHNSTDNEDEGAAWTSTGNPGVAGEDKLHYTAWCNSQLAA